MRSQDNKLIEFSVRKENKFLGMVQAELTKMVLELAEGKFVDLNNNK